MASVIQGFDYDVFVSYRHNDNLDEGWVTNFIFKLKQELQATIKDHLTVYFDENPEDGLLEYQSVDKSLEKKLKALIFIPIVSKTYCDIEKYAWKNEFLIFKSLASEDPYGLNMTLSNGNVANRILPVKIHNLDEDDVRLLEKELEGNLRSIDFIYEGIDGVNRPLRAKDDELGFRGKNVLFRNQINKMANAISELIRGIKVADYQIQKGIYRKPSFTSTPVVNQSVPVSSLSYNESSISQFENPNPFNNSFAGESKKSTVFLAWTSSDIKSVREELYLILQKAGMNVVPYMDCPADEEMFKQKVGEFLKISDCSVHVLSGEFGRRFELEDNISFPKYQFYEAQSFLKNNNKNFKLFIWNNPINQIVKSEQQSFINDIRNSITHNMMFTNVTGPLQLVDDIRSVMNAKPASVFDTNETDIFFISNQLDEVDAQNITNQLSQEVPLETMTIIQDRQDQYKEKSAQQIKHSKLAVVYFKDAAEWAIPFVKQMWKMVGGATSKTPILLIGEDLPETNLYRTFKAPKVISTVVPNSKVVSEIKNTLSQYSAQ